MDDFELPSYEVALSVREKDFMSSVNEGFEPELVSPISPTAPVLIQKRPKIYMPNTAALTEEMIRQACCEYAEDSCCYGTRFIRNMVMTSITNSFTFNYKLESYGEKRETVSRFTPYYGQVIDGPDNGPDPDPWDVAVPVPVEFKNSQTKVEIPHTAHIRQCDTCRGNRRVPCDSCYGNGWYTCFHCEGRGRDSDNDLCPSCNGSGKRKCLICSGTGQVECRICDGYGRLKHYKLLIVTRKTHEDEFLSNTMNLPKECILALSGRVIFSEQGPEILPLTNAPDRLVCEASSNLIHKHQTAFPNELIIMQRHTLRAVPLTRVTYSWGSTDGEFYVYGFKNKVYFEKYPQKCCCCSCM